MAVAELGVGRRLRHVTTVSVTPKRIVLGRDVSCEIRRDQLSHLLGLALLVLYAVSV
jgi:hypothetical protein